MGYSVEVETLGRFEHYQLFFYDNGYQTGVLGFSCLATAIWTPDGRRVPLVGGAQKFEAGDYIRIGALEKINGKRI